MTFGCSMKPVPSRATMVDEIVVGFEDVVREPVVAQELPDAWFVMLDQTLRALGNCPKKRRI